MPADDVEEVASAVPGEPLPGPSGGTTIGPGLDGGWAEVATRPGRRPKAKSIRDPRDLRRPGGGIAQGTRLGRVASTQVAPAIARPRGLDLPNAVGQPPSGLLFRPAR